MDSHYGHPKLNYGYQWLEYVFVFGFPYSTHLPMPRIYCCFIHFILFFFFYYTPTPTPPHPQRSWRGVHGFTLPVCPSVRLWAESCPQCIIHNTSIIHFIFTDLNNQLQKVCRVLNFVTNSKIRIFGNFFKISPFTLSLVHVMRMLIPLIRVFIVATSNFPCWYLWVIY